MGMHTRNEVRDYITNNLDEAIDLIQDLLTVPCEDDCLVCPFDYLCVEEGLIAEEGEVTDGTNEAVPDGKDTGTSKPSGDS